MISSNVVKVSKINKSLPYGEVDWCQIKPITIDHYPWYTSGKRQTTFVKLFRTKDMFYIHVYAQDIHSSAYVMEPNGSVYLDSCFEFFVTPDNEVSDDYINFEINCIGTIYLATKKQGVSKCACLADLEHISVETTLPKGVVKYSDTNDKSWGLRLSIPLDLMEKLWEGPIHDEAWQCNFYRCGGSIDAQYAAWSYLSAAKPDFHLPRQFGLIEFTDA